MMITKYDTEISEENLISYMERLKNRVFKVIPYREQYIPIDKYLQGLINELLSLDELLKYPIYIELICNLNTLLTLGSFKETKKQTFKCLDIIEKMIKLMNK